MKYNLNFHAGDHPGTAEAIASSIEKNIFSHARKLLMGWKKVHEDKFGEGSWEKAVGPSPENIGMHRLTENTLC